MCCKSQKSLLILYVIKISVIMSVEEAEKIKQHLELLREEHVKLQGQLASLQRKYDVLEASAAVRDGGGDSVDSGSFVSRLVRIVGELFAKDLYR